MADGGSVGDLPGLAFHSPAQVQIAALHQCCDLAVGDGTVEHPEAAVGMDPADTAGSEDALGAFDAGGDLIGRFDVVDLDVDHADSDADARIDLLDGESDPLRGDGAISRTT